jgi:hypothetical protein
MLIVFMMQFTQLAYAYGVSINWNRNSESDIAGYKVYYGTATHNYQNMLDVGPFTTAVIDGLNGGVTYYFAVTAYDTSGNESVNSQEVQAIIPTASSNIYTLTITKKGTGTGTVTTSPTGTTFSAGTAVTLTATPNSNSTFAGWSGGYSGSLANKCIVIMNNNVSVSAAFNLKTYTITASAGRGGSISPAGSISVNSGSYRAFIFKPNTGYCISSVKIDGISISPITSYTFNNIKANHTISASFKRLIR